MMYNVFCIKCGKRYQSRANRNGTCSECKKTTSQRSMETRAKNYDAVMVYVPKGKRDFYKTFAGRCGMTMNEFFNRSLDAYVEKMTKENKIIIDVEQEVKAD